MPESVGALALCRLDELPDGGSLRVDFADDSHAHGIAVIRRGGTVHAYLNRCPHQDMAMDWLRGRFLDETGQRIVCAMHGAAFRVEDGVCVGGPCKGQRLSALPVNVADGRVWVDEEALAPYRD